MHQINLKTLDDADHRRVGWLLAQTHQHSQSGRTLHWKITARSRGGVVLWVGNIDDARDAWRFWARLEAGSLGYQDYVIPQPAYCPSIREIADVVYELATVVSFTATGTTSWLVPAGIFSVAYLVVAGGGGGGRRGGGGGAGGYLEAASYATSPGASLTVTVGIGGAGSVSRLAAGTSGGNSVFDAITSTGGGGAGSGAVNGVNGGSGGGSFTATAGTGTGGQGNNGGNSAGVDGSGGGGGAAAVGQSVAGSAGGNGGNGLSSSISGSPASFAGGGGGSGMAGSGAGTGGTGGGGAGATGTANGTAGTANTGGGGGGAKDEAAGGGNGGAGGSGIVILSYSPNSIAGFNMPMLGM